MPEISHSITINKPVTEVFRTVSDFNSAKQWQPDVIESHQSDEKLRVGAFITQSRGTRALHWRLDLNADIINYIPNRVIEYKGIVGRFPITGRYEFESVGGKTTVRETMNIQISWLFSLFSPFVTNAMSRRTKRALEQLKIMLESSSPISGEPTTFHKEV